MNVGAKLSKYVSRNFNCNCKKIDVFDVILFQIYYGAYVPIIIRIKKDLTKLLQKWNDAVLCITLVAPLHFRVWKCADLGTAKILVASPLCPSANDGDDPIFNNDTSTDGKEEYMDEPSLFEADFQDINIHRNYQSLSC